MGIAFHRNLDHRRIPVRYAIPSPEQVEAVINFVISGKSNPLPFLLWLCLFWAILPPSIIWGQGFDNDPLFMEEEEYRGFGEDFRDSDFGDDFMDPGLLEEEGSYDPFSDPTEEDEMYLDEDQFGVDTEQALKESLLDQGTLMQREKREGMSNILYGAGTGLLIGAWTAFITQETTTRNQWRTIGTSTILGGTIGMMLGTRSIWDPNAARPASASSDSGSEWLVFHEPTGFKIAYLLRF